MRRKFKENVKQEYHRRELSELNLLDDFLFWAVVSYPEIGVQVVREILRIVFHREFGNLRITAQKVYYGKNTDKHGARLDVYLEEEDVSALAQPGSIFDVEPNLREDKKSIAELPQRVRFYHSTIDTDCLKSGEGYHALKNVLVIMITPFDPFDRGRMQYTIKRSCAEEPDMPYEDGAVTLFLNTKGTKEIPSQDLKELLHYMEESVPENAVSPSLKIIHGLVDRVKHSKEVSRDYMRWIELQEMWMDQGQEKERANTERERANTERERANAERERIRADEAEQQASRERQRADNAERELAQLRDELARLRKTLQVSS